MTTTVNQKVANPNFPTGGASGTTGTGNLVFSESPTINNANLTGSVSANVNLRSGTLATLLPLAGGTSELGYATDANALVRFNGTAGGAEVLPGATLNWFLSATSYAANQITPLDCTNVSVLNIIYDLIDPPDFIYNLNIKLPSGQFEKTLKVKFLSGFIFGGPLSSNPGTITLTYNAYDIAAGSDQYYPIAADKNGLVPSFWLNDGFANSAPYEFTFYPVLGQAWTRTPVPGEAYLKRDISFDPTFETGFTLSIIGSYAQYYSSNNSSPASNTNVNLGSAINLPVGVWSISGKIRFQSTNSSFALTDFTAELFSATNGGNIAVTNQGAIRQRVVNTTVPNGENLAFSFPTIVLQVSGAVSYTNPYYNRVNMTYAAGSAIPTIEWTAVRIA